MFSYEFTVNAQTLTEASRICRQLSQTILDGFPRRTGKSPTSSFSFKRIDTSDQIQLVVIPDIKDRTEGEMQVIDRLRSNEAADSEFVNGCLATESRIVELAHLIKKNSHADSAVYLWKELEKTVNKLTATVENGEVPVVVEEEEEDVCWEDDNLEGGAESATKPAEPEETAQEPAGEGLDPVEQESPAKVDAEGDSPDPDTVEDTKASGPQPSKPLSAIEEAFK